MYVIGSLRGFISRDFTQCKLSRTKVKLECLRSDKKVNIGNMGRQK